MGRQGELDLPRQGRGGARKGAGRPRKGHRSSERHQVRPVIAAREPQHVVTRVVPRAHGLRRRDAYAAIRDASFVAAAHAPDFRIVHLSIQRTHLHLIVEAKNRTALAKGMQSFLISSARGINAALAKRTRRAQRGSVFADRYHARALRTPRQARNCIAYVLNNWRRHGEDRDRPWKLDPFSSGIGFGGWRELEGRPFGFRPPPSYASLIVWLPKTWLLATGWRKHGRIGAFDVPGGLE
ncbi:MAG TPA: transposase [Kofleriaceae bacterium]|jgi:REP element-mobilizing transposase RayT